ncbi:putative MFS family arabinose efflux permease [Knoellia remsis]|uniref:Putative MFS family arabinose efflux permease n=1 Tax=Knoellia remsis TaxID=407159 RepID=A0A2T0UGK7_9MICO|nr:MFS transporter [Knoellia remsis]PRY57042.1 putative MFS family arabinose efflux permease [Knoellia remsis]
MTIPTHTALDPRPTPRGLECGQKPTEPKSPLFVAVLGLAQFGIFVALLGPVMVSMALKVNSLVTDPTERTSAVGLVLGVGAIAAFVGNALFGRLSDRTTSRFGRRRPWLVGGVLVMALALLAISQATAIWQLAVGWFIAQLGANAAFAPYIATLADQLPEKQYAKVSAMVGTMQSVSILAATAIATQFTENMLALFMVPALIGVITVVGYAAVLPDPVLRERPAPLDLRTLASTFWVNPVKHPDFGLAWWSRFLIILSSFLFTTFRLNFLVDRVDLTDAEAAAAVFTGVLIYTVVLVVASWVAGVISDRTGRRKGLVAASSLLFGIGVAILAQAHSLPAFYVVEAIMGVAYGIYVSVDLALVLQVLPNPEDSGKDLGVFNMANAIPQSAAPFLGSVLLASGAAAGPNYQLLFWGAAIAAALGALVVLPIRKVK